MALLMIRLFLFLLDQKFARFDDRFVTIEYEDATTWHTIDKLINDRYFLIVDRERANLIADFYGNLKLHVSKEGLLSTMSNIAIRKNLNEPGKTHLLEVSKKIFHYFFSIKLVDFISTLNICTDRDLCHTYIFLVVVMVVCSLFDPFKIMPDLFIHSFIFGLL